MMAHLHWFILCGLSSASVPSQSRSNPPTDPAPRPSDWCLRGVENYAASISISHHLLKLQLIQLHLAPSALLSSNSLKLQPMLCACYVVQCAYSAMSVDKDFSSLSDVTWYSVHVLRCHHCTCFMISEDTDLSGDTHTCHHCLQSKQMGTQGWPPTNNHKSTLISSGIQFDHFSIGSWALISGKIQGKWENGEVFPMMGGGRGSLFTQEN